MENTELKLIWENCSEVDIAILKNLLLSEGFDVQPVVESSANSMGIDLVGLSILIPVATAAISGFVSVLKAWMKNRKVDYSIEDTKSGLKFSYSSQSGKLLSDSDLERMIYNIFRKE